MASNSEKWLGEVRLLFEKKQNAKAITTVAQLLKKKEATDSCYALLTICNEFQQHDFVLHTLKTKLKSKTDIVADLNFLADTVKLRLAVDIPSTKETLLWTANYVESLFPFANTAAGLIWGMAVRMGYEISSRRHVVVVLWEDFLFSLIKKLLKKQLYSDALALESAAYEVYVKQSESESAFSEFMSLASLEMEAAGRKLLENTQTVETDLGHKAERAERVESEKFTAAFVIHHESMLAHIAAMLGFFEGLQGLENNRITPVVFSLSGKDTALLAQCEMLNVKVVSLEDANTDLYNKILLLKEKIAAEKCKTVVWLCLANWMCFSFALRLAPVQIWWSMKYHDFASSDIDGYLCRFIVDSNFYNGKWKGGYLAVNHLLQEGQAVAASRVKEKYPGKIILGTMGRAELINDERFLNAVIAVLKNNENAVYLWTGREEVQSITAAFSNADVLQQTHFIGWVDTKLYAHVFDIYLDVFRFGTGFTLVEAMAANTPVVFLDEKRDFSVLDVLRGLISHAYITLDSDQLALLTTLTATTVQDYVGIVNKLIASASFREAAGELLATLANIFENKTLSANIYHDHIVDIVASKNKINSLDAGNALS